MLMLDKNFYVELQLLKFWFKIKSLKFLSFVKVEIGIQASSLNLKTSLYYFIIIICLDEEASSKVPSKVL